jgi:superfamily I DNA and/or RNA helicase
MVSTVDAFQGQEKDIIILTCVRGNPSRMIGFLRD